MFKPKYRLSLNGECFPHDIAICLGTQLKSLVDSLEDLLPSHLWYGANVEAVGKGVPLYNVSSFRPSLIGADWQFKEYCAQIDQFIWGEFLCVESGIETQQMQKVEIETEDEPFRSISCEGILLEIRTFDTSYFEIYSERIELIIGLSSKHKVEIEEAVAD